MFQLPQLAPEGLVWLWICAHFSREEGPVPDLGRELLVIAKVGEIDGEAIIASKVIGTEKDVKHYHVDARLESMRSALAPDARPRTSKKSQHEVLTPPKTLLGKELAVTIGGVFHLSLSKLPEGRFIRTLADVSIQSGTAILTIQGCVANVSDDDEIRELRWSLEGKDEVTIDVVAYRRLEINDDTFREAQSTVENGLERLVLGGAKKKHGKTDDK